MGDKLEYCALKVFKFIVNILPEKLNYYLACALGTVLYYLVRSRRKLGIENVKEALGYSEEDAQQLIKEVFQDLVIKIVEVLTVESWNQEDFNDRIKIEGEEYLKKTYEEERGIILFTGHFGNWELLGLYLCVLGYPVNALARERSNELIAKEIWNIRESRGGRVFDYKKEIRNAFKALLKNELLLVLADQEAGSNGQFVQFFHKLAWTPPGPVELAAKTDSVIIPIYLTREDRGKYKLHIEAPLEVPKGASTTAKQKALQKLTFSLERKILEYPKQWLWLHDRWDSDPPKEEDS